LKQARGGVRSYSGAISGGIYATTTTTTTTVAPISGKVQVYIMMGQSNMLGEGHISGSSDGTLEYATKTKGLYPYLLDSSTGEWAHVDNVRDVAVMGSGGPTGTIGAVHHNEWISVNPSKKSTIGPELGIGFTMANATDAPTMLLKSCIGNRALGWDLLPPGSEQYEYTSGGKTYVYAGYGESPNRWEKGTTPKPISWYAGLQYDGDIDRADRVLADLGTFYPGASDYEVAGFFWWQGDKDRYDTGLASRYELNLVNLITALRTKYSAPNAKFVLATLGQTEKGATGNEGLILDGMFAVDGKSGKYPEFAGNVATVYSHPLSKGGASSSHYGQNAETYMNIGEAMGAAMAELLKGDSISFV